MSCRRWTVLATIVLLLTAYTQPVFSADPIHLYLDADFTGAAASGVAIERGMRTALDEVDNKLAGHPVEIVVLNHRGNNARSLANLRKFLADPNAFALFTGLHSPPLLAHRDFINNNGILTFTPWAAAGPITRAADDNNWIFRLSIDDTKAGEVIVQRSVDRRNLSRPALLLENTGWGTSNLKTMTASLKKRALVPVVVSRFDWGLSLSAAKILLRDISKSGADVIFLVANAAEGKTICRAMSELSPQLRLPVISHWGITGGDFPKAVPAMMRESLDLEFLQTSFSFMDMANATFANKVFNTAARLFDLEKPSDITAPTGFIHAYDLTRLLIAAVRQSGLTAAPWDMHDARSRVRMALQNLDRPVQGLVKTYSTPFRPYTPADPDAHEALEADYYLFGKYNEQNAIILVR